MAKMKPPFMKCGDYKFEYIQVPYKNRFFIIYYKNVEIARIPSMWNHIFESFACIINANWERSYDKFMYKITQYNKYLDDSEG